MPRRKEKLVPRVEEVSENETVRKIREKVLRMSVEEQKTFKPEGVPLYSLDPKDFKLKQCMTFYTRVFKAVKVQKHRNSKDDKIEDLKQQLKRAKQLQNKSKERYNKMAQRDRTRKRIQVLQMSGERNVLRLEKEKMEMEKQLMKMERQQLQKEKKAWEMEKTIARIELEKMTYEVGIREKRVHEKELVANQIFYANMKIYRDYSQSMAQHTQQYGIISDQNENLGVDSQNVERYPEDINDDANYDDPPVLDGNEVGSFFRTLALGAPEMSNSSVANSVNAEAAIHQYSEVVDYGQGNDLTGSQNEYPSEVVTSLDISKPNGFFPSLEQAKSLDRIIPELQQPSSSSLHRVNNGNLPQLIQEIVGDAVSKMDMDMTPNFKDHDGVNTPGIFEDQGLLPANLAEESFDLSYE